MATRTPKSNEMSIKTTLDVHHTFGYISLLSLQDYDVKILNFTFYGGHKTTISSLFLNLNRVLKNSTPEKFSSVCQIHERKEIRAMKFDKARIHKFSDVTAAVAWSRGCLSPTLKTLGFSFIKRDTVISLR